MWSFLRNIWYAQENAKLLVEAHEELADRDKAYKELFATWRKQCEQLREYRKTTPGRNAKGQYAKKPGFSSPRKQH